MRRLFPVPVVQLFVMLLILLAINPNAAATSPPSSNGPAALGLSSGAVASSMMGPSLYCDPWNYTLCYSYYWGYPWYYYPYYYGYYGYGYYPYYYSTAAEKTKTFELKVETNPAGIAAVGGKGTYNQGTIASFSLTSLIVSVSANERYVFSYWSGDFSGSAPSGTITMDSAKTVIANYRIEYYLKVSIDPPGIAPAVGDGWYQSGESATVGAVPSSVSGGEGTRYVFQDWTIDSVPVSGNSVDVTMDAPHTVVAHYKTQYLLTVLSEYGIVQGRGWYDAGSVATFSVTTQVDAGYGVKQVFDRWIGDAESTSPTATITMDSPHTVQALWRTDSTILYATVALGIIAAFALGIGLALFAIPRLQRAKPAPTAPSPAPSLEPVATAETPPAKVKPPPAKKKVKPPPETEPSS